MAFQKRFANSQAPNVGRNQPYDDRSDFDRGPQAQFDSRRELGGPARFDSYGGGDHGWTPTNRGFHSDDRQLGAGVSQFMRPSIESRMNPDPSFRPAYDDTSVQRRQSPPRVKEPDLKTRVNQGLKQLQGLLALHVSLESIILYPST